MSLSPKENNPTTLTGTVPGSSSLSRGVGVASGLSTLLHGVASFLKLDVVARAFKRLWDWWYGYVISEDLSYVVTEAGEYVVCDAEAFDKTTEGAASLSGETTAESTLTGTDEGGSSWLPLS